jgi:hypothetical protein
MRRLITLCSLLGAISVGWWLRAQLATSPPPMAAHMPAGALLYLEAKDFGKLLGEWNNSQEKAKWLGSANYDVLSRSRLIGRLQQAQGELEQTAGVSAQMKLLQQVAGTSSAFAFYNLGALRFVYITHLDHGRIEASDLWKQRAQYQPREAAGIAFYVKQDAQNGRTVAFATKDDVFAIATDESLMATTLGLLAGQPAPSLARTEWFQNITAGRRQGDLRLVYDLQATENTPQFRTYWIQENETELKEYASGISDLFETSAGFEEQRVLLRAQPSQAPNASAAIETLVSAVAPGDSLYRAWANPSKQQLAASLTQVVYGQAPAANPLANEMAPVAPAGFAQPAYAPGLQTKIDQPPVTKEGRKPIDTLVDTIIAMQPAALLHVQSTVALRDSVFIVPESAVAIVCGRPDVNAVETDLHNMLGAAVESGGLDQLTVRAEGNVLVIGRGAGLINNTNGQAQATAETYAAGYNHAAEWPKYTRLFRLIDGPAGGARAQGQPAFFASNLQSLGDALNRLQRASLKRTDNGNGIAETVLYEMK